MSQGEWEAAVSTSTYEGSADDLRDGFIHLSTADQLHGTLEKHFSGRKNLVLVCFCESEIDDDLKWEPSRGGALFPHYYGGLDPQLALWIKALPIDGKGNHIVPEDVR